MKKTYLGVLVLLALPVPASAWEDRPLELHLRQYADPPAIARSGPRFAGDLLVLVPPGSARNRPVRETRARRPKQAWRTRGRVVGWTRVTAHSDVGLELKRMSQRHAPGAACGRFSTCCSCRAAHG